MSTFVRLYIGRNSGEIRHVVEQDTPFIGAGPALHDSVEPLEAVDLGFAEEHPWTKPDGEPCPASMHFWRRLGHMKLDRAREELARGTGATFPRVHDCPCSEEGIAARLRAKGPAGLPVKARAWLANVMNPEKVAAWGIARGIPLSAIKAAEAARVRRDPASGSRVHLIERRVHVFAASQAKSRAKRARKAQARAAATAERKAKKGKPA
jgi:hypothetical protein